MKTYTNLCSRCGTERIVVKSWQEKIGISTVTNTEKACPDAECQKKVDLDNKKQRDKNAAMKLKSEQRALHRKAQKDAERAEKNH